MTSPNKIKQQLLSDIEYFQSLCINRPTIANQYQTVAKAIKDNFYRILVLGEFKRGKSTFVNAVLGKDVLPMDVLPETATINAVMYSTEPRLQVIYKNGQVTEGELSKDYLFQFSANNTSNVASQVEYIKIGYPIDFLKNRIILIDTPGVEDLDDTRCEVTYGILPTADAVLFLLDADSPLTKSEKTFLDRMMEQTGVKDIIFIVNKFDGVDEDEDPDFIDKITTRIKNAFVTEDGICKLPKITVLPLSAKYALEGLETNDEELVEESRLPEVIEEIKLSLLNSSLEKRKLEVYRRKLAIITQRFIQSIDVDINLKESSLDELKAVVKSLSEMIQQREDYSDKITAYIDKNKDSIYAMTDKSLQFFGKNLRDDILEWLDDYKGTDFKEFVEVKLSKRIQKNIEAWINSYIPHINNLINSTERELSLAVSRNFNKQINLARNSVGEFTSSKTNFEVQSPDISNVNLQAGALTAIGGIGLLIAVGGVVMPLISFAAAPFLREYLLKSKLKKAKADITPAIENHITKALMRLQAEIHNYINEHMTKVLLNTEYIYSNLIEEFSKTIQGEIEAKEKNSENINDEVNSLLLIRDKLNSKLIEWRAN